MVKSIMDNSTMIKDKAKAYFIGQTAEFMMEIGIKTNSMEQANTQIKVVK